MEKKYGMGWRPDYPDHRDFGLGMFHATSADEPLESKAARQKNAAPDKDSALFFDLEIKEPLLTVDLRKHCSDVRYQGDLGACTAFAGVSLIEYYEKRNKGSYIPASPLFLYKATRNFMKIQTGDSGADPRSTMAAMVLFGVPPEKYYEYNQANYDAEPASFLYSFAQNYKSVKFFRHDLPGNKNIANTLKSIKLALTNGIPAMCGFTLYGGSFNQSKEDKDGVRGRFPFPHKYDAPVGGHAISVFGYDDAIEIKNLSDDSVTHGAFLIKNSWGKEWGENGYGWLPYKYLDSGLAVDWWSIIKLEWVDTDCFGEIAPFEIKKPLTENNSK